MVGDSESVEKRGGLERLQRAESINTSACILVPDARPVAFVRTCTTEMSPIATALKRIPAEAQGLS